MSNECRICGKNGFKSRKGMAVHIGQVHPNEHWIEERELRRLYHEDGMSMYDLADRYDTSKAAIQTAFRAYDINARKSYRADNYPPTHEFVSISDSIGHEYEIVRTKVGGKHERVLIHRLIAIAVGELDTADLCNFDIVVHHKSEHGLDNRPDNLAVMDRGEHQRMHVLQRHE